MFLLCLCWLRCLMPRFILYSLLCSLSFMMFSSFSFGYFVIGHVCTLFMRQLILDFYVHMGGRSYLEIWYLFCVCFLYIANSSFVFLWCIVRSRKLMELCCSFSMVNFILVCHLLNLAKVLSMYVLFWF
jgi:multisubunit Na+/H+ antiporter MnhE subunit